MILSFDEAGALLDEMAEEFPPEFYDELNGGISLLPEAKEDPEGEPGELYIMGEYCNDMMGKYINLYYGSFAALAEQEDWTAEDWEDELTPPWPTSSPITSRAAPESGAWSARTSSS